MGENITWCSFKAIAELVNAKHPHIDVLSISDEALENMVLGIEGLNELPPLTDNKGETLFLLKCALARLIEGDEDYDAHQGDAYV